jgi:hypothetical protein
MPAGGISQKAIAFNRGKAISLAPNIKGNKVIAKCTVHHGHDPEEDHHGAMKGEELVISFSADEIGDRTGQLRTNHPGKGATDQVEDETRNQVLKPDHLVIQAETEIAQPTFWLQALLEVAGVSNGHDGGRRGVCVEKKS